ncbi:hypothetical protein EYR36_010075 [Pleurotus pulmonarius]|nr:hypothetical protein EYR36_010075 [Pleurotus pulmonarius]
MRAYFRYAPETTGKSQKKGLKKTKGALSTGKSKPIRSVAVSARKSSRKGRIVTKASDVSISPPPAKLPSSSSRSRPRVYASEEVDEDDISRDEGGRALGMVTVRKKVPQPAPHQRGRSILAPEHVPKFSNRDITLTGIAGPLNLSRKIPSAWTSCFRASMHTKSRCFSPKAFYVS